MSPLLAANGLFGFEYNSYVWRGYGLDTQLWGMILLPMALAQAYAVLRDGRGYLLAVVLLMLTCLSHLAFGYMALLSLVLLAILTTSRDAIWTSARRMLFLLVPLLAAISYFMVPLVLDSAYLGRSVFDAAWKYDSFGHEKILRWLVSGELFDVGRFPPSRLPLPWVSWPARRGFASACSGSPSRFSSSGCCSGSAARPGALSST